MFIERDLVRLVIQLHPYTPPPNTPTMIFCPPIPPTTALTAAQAGNIRTGVPAAGGPLANLDAALDAAVTPNFTVFNFETQDNPAYEMDWTWVFKGQERIIRRALRFS